MLLINNIKNMCIWSPSTGDFTPKSLVQESKFHIQWHSMISAAGWSVKSYGRNQLQKPLSIMINIVTKPF